MRIPPAVIEQIVARTDLVDVISQRVKLKKTGRTYSGCCPFHQEKSPSFHVYREKGYYHCFGCQANGDAIRFLMDMDRRSFMEVVTDLANKAGVELPKSDSQQAPGYRYTRQKSSSESSSSTSRTPPDARSAEKVVQTTDKPAARTTKTPTPSTGSPASAGRMPSRDQPQGDGLTQPEEWAEPGEWAESSPQEVSDWYPDASLEPMEWPESTDDFIFLPVEPPEDSAPFNPNGNLYDLSEAIAIYYQEALRQHLPAQQYLQRRGLKDSTLSQWRLGYAPDGWQHLLQQFPQDIEGLKALGLIRTSDNGRDFCLLRDRVIFCIRDNRGRVVGFGGRAMNNEIKPKYINSPESVLFQKNRLLFGLYESLQARAQHWLIVEGYLDVIGLHQAGIPGAVATMGTATNADHLATLFKLNHRVTLAFDGDAAGQKAAWRTLEMALPLLSDDRELRFLVLPEEHDPDSLVQLEGAEGMRKRIEQAPPLSDYVYGVLSRHCDLNHPEGKSQLMQQARQLFQQLPAQGNYRRLLDQTFREKLGLSYQGNRPAVTNAEGDYSQSQVEELLLMLLLHYPELAPMVSTTVTLLEPPHPVLTALRLIGQMPEDFPQTPDASVPFLIAAWPNDIQRQRVCQILERKDVEHWLGVTPDPAVLGRDTALLLQDLLLHARISSATNLAEKVKLRHQLNALRRQRSLMPDAQGGSKP